MAISGRRTRRRQVVGEVYHGPRWDHQASQVDRLAETTDHISGSDSQLRNASNRREDHAIWQGKRHDEKGGSIYAPRRAVQASQPATRREGVRPPRIRRDGIAGKQLRGGPDIDFPSASHDYAASALMTRSRYVVPGDRRGRAPIGRPGFVAPQAL